MGLDSFRVPNLVVYCCIRLMASAVGFNGSQNVEPRPTPVMVPTVWGAVAMSTSLRPGCCGGWLRRRMKLLLEMAAMEPADPTADADEEIRKGPELSDKELTTIFRRGWDKKEEEASDDV